MIEFRIIELNEDKSIKKVWFTSHNIGTKKSDINTVLEQHYDGALRLLDDQYDLFHFDKDLETEISDDGGKTWSYYGDTTIDYYNMLNS